MKAGQVIEQDVPVQISLRIAKVDKATREVEGVCTQEVTDVHGEIVDHASMKAALLDWPGNIREMHQPIAVGKAVSVVSDDEAKATILRARVSKGAPETWEKVLDETLCMYSIGGTGKRVTTKKADGTEEKRLFINKLMEVSLVDNGACPTAKFQIVKAIDGVATHIQPADEGEIGDDTDPALPEEGGQPGMIRRAALLEALAPFAKMAVAAAAHQQLQASTDEVIEKRAYPAPYMINRTLGAIALLEEILAEEWWRASDAEASGDDASTDKAQLQVLRNAIELVMAYLLSEFNAQFADLDAEASAADVDVMNAARARRAELVEKAAFALPVVFSKIDGTGQMWFAKAGARHSKTDSAMVQAMHDTAVSLGAIDCAACTKAADAPADEPALEKAADAAGTPAQEASETPADAQPVAVAEPAQAAATTLDTPIQHAAGLTEASVQQIVKAAVDQALQAHQATSAATIAELQAQITKLSNEPLPGGPKARATGTEGTPVHKALGGHGSGPMDGLDPAQVQAFAEQLAKEAKTPEERDRIVTNLLKFQHATGVGAVVVQQSVSRRPDA